MTHVRTVNFSAYIIFNIDSTISYYVLFLSEFGETGSTATNMQEPYFLVLVSERLSEGLYLFYIKRLKGFHVFAVPIGWKKEFLSRITKPKRDETGYEKYLFSEA